MNMDSIAGRLRKNPNNERLGLEQRNRCIEIFEAARTHRGEEDEP